MGQKHFVLLAVLANAKTIFLLPKPEQTKLECLPLASFIRIV
jgi:hypothetical protein